MATIDNNIEQIRADFHSIRNSLVQKNLNVPVGTPTSKYSELIDSLTTYNLQEYQRWLLYGGLEKDAYNSLEEVLNSEDYELLLNTQKSAAFAAFISEEIANKIKSDTNYLKKALFSINNEMFIKSDFNFEETIDELTEENPKVNANNYYGIVTCDADRCSEPDAAIYEGNPPKDYGYHCYMAFDNSSDSEDLHINYKNRHIWSAIGKNHWVQYKYPSPKRLCKIFVYSVRDNAPLSIKIEGSNNGEDFSLIKEQLLSGTIGVTHYEVVNCYSLDEYQYFRFTISDTVEGDNCTVGEIRIFTFK